MTTTSFHKSAGVGISDQARVPAKQIEANTSSPVVIPFAPPNGSNADAAACSPFTSFVVDPLDATGASFYVGAACGVLRALNYGQQIVAMNTGLPPNLQINALGITPAGDTLYAGATNGGVYRYTVSAQPPTQLAFSNVNYGLSPTVGVAFDLVVKAVAADLSAQNVVGNTEVQLSLASGAGTLGGTMNCEILAGSNTCTVIDVTYSKADTNVVLTATRTSGDTLTPGNSAPFSVAAIGFPTEPCGTGSYPFPYTDVASVTNPFCPGIMEAYVTGVSKGTSPTSFSPNNTVTRVQMTTFLQRSLDQGLARTSRRAALNQWSTPQSTNAMQTISLGDHPRACAADGENIWTVTTHNVVQVQANTGKVLGTWTGATTSLALLVAAGKVFATDQKAPAALYVIDPTMPPGVLTSSATLPGGALSMAFDGTNIWTANGGTLVSIITPQSPYTVTTVTTGFIHPVGILYDGAHIWVTDSSAQTLLKLDPTGVILQTVNVGAAPEIPVFDGTNIWVPNFSDSSITVVQASSGNVVATIASDANNQLSGPNAASFDGERVLVTNGIGNSVTVFKAADLSFIGNVSTGSSTTPIGACSDGINFWVPLNVTGNLLRF
jgi:hypothetical protein